MQILISAPPRTGKSLYCMDLIDKLSRKQPNRRIYTNIIGMNYPGVLQINSSVDNPFDWRDLPDGSIIFFDEAHEHPAFSAKDLLPPAKTPDEKLKKQRVLDIGESLTLHGHFGFDIYLITQNPKLLNDHVLASCSIHYVMRRLFGLDIAMIYEFAEVQKYFANSTRKQALSVKRFPYPKNLYKYYISSNVHNVQKRIPPVLIILLLIPILLLGFAYKKASDTGFFGLFGEPEKEVLQPEYEVLNYEDYKESGLTPQQLLNVNDLDLECRKGSNVDKPECVEWFNKQTELTNQQSQLISYNPDKPYDFEYKPNVQPNDFPRMSGVITLRNKKLIAVDQQGNYMPQVSQEDCKRWLSGYRPFNYFNNQIVGMNNETIPPKTPGAPINQQATESIDPQNIPVTTYSLPDRTVYNHSNNL